MQMKTLLFPLLFFAAFRVSAQEDTLLLSRFSDSVNYKIVIRTEEKIEDRYIALDNMTARVTDDTTKVYYMHYSEGLVSSVTIPYSVYRQFLAFEQKIRALTCDKPECNHSVLFEIGSAAVRIPIDILSLESLSSFMLELEQ